MHGSGPTLNQTFRHEELHVFVIDQMNIKESLKAFVGLYSLRTWKRKEFWLFDITQWTKEYSKDQLLNQIRYDFRDLVLDFDDDLYLFSGIY